MTKSITRLKINYLDASAAVRLVLDEPGSDDLKNYFHNEHNGSFHITSLCLAEALGVLKRKWQPDEIISMKDYFHKCYLLLAYVRGKPKSIQLDDTQPSDLNVFTATEEIARRYELDLSDALQLVTIKRRFSKLKPKPSFITADSALATAAQNEGIGVWNCSRSTRQNRAYRVDGLPP